MLGWGLTWWSGSPGCSISAMPRSMRWAPIPSRYRALVSVSASGRRCRSPACSPPFGVILWAFRCCACAATISPSSRWASARSSASCCSTGRQRHRRPQRHQRHSAAVVLRHALPAPWRPKASTTFQSVLRHLAFDAGAAHDFPLFRDPGAGAGDQFFTLRLRRLPIGRAWEALREDEIACRALGINPDQGQALRLRHRRHARRLRRRLLRDAPGLHQPGKLHLPGMRHHPRHRRSGRAWAARWAWCSRRSCW